MTSLDRIGLFSVLGRIAEGVVAVIGSHCEIVIHDFSDLEHSAVAVFGGVSGREPGAPVPDLDFISNDQILNLNHILRQHYFDLYVVK